MKSHNDGPFWSGNPDVETFGALQHERLAKAGKALSKLLAIRGARTIENTLLLYDEIFVHVDSASSQSSLIEQVHPNPAMRAQAEKLTQETAAFATEISLNRDVYDVLAAINPKNADAATQYYLSRTLRDFRLAGVDKDESTRKRVKELRDEIVLIGQEFARNIREDKRTVAARNVSELDGLPHDFIDRHKPNADGSVTLTIEHPDAIPVLSYAKSDDLRRRMYFEFNNRAYPKNMAVLDKLLAKRHELALILGFRNWADLATADKMVGSGQNASDFVEKIAHASEPKGKADYDVLLQRKQKENPESQNVNAWEAGYWSELVKKSDYDFNAQSVRPYFPFDRVKDGVLSVMSRLFGFEFRVLVDAPVWHPSVECFEIFTDERLAGRFYLDMHPRADKFNHAAEFAVRSGVAGLQIPEAALICNFPGGGEGEPGLMEHSDVVTFFHEFGHLLHHMFGGHQKWVGISGIQTEWDFVEAPSQMLEEWAWDPTTLGAFAKHYQTSEPIPEELVRRMKRASEFGKGLQVRTQMSYARLSLSCHDRDPREIETDALTKSIYERYRPFKYVVGTHFQCAFGHLTDYSAVYYTYMWSLVIAKDFFSQFDRKNLLSSTIAQKYRDSILAPGGSKPATELVRDFLGRDFSFDAWQAWLDEGKTL